MLWASAALSIIGATSISGGVGNNVVIADNADQFIVLGAGDDELHGGGGNDLIGSNGGDDLIFGDAGNDRLFGGEGNDQLNGGSGVDVARFGAMKNSVQRYQAAAGSPTISSAATGVDTLTGVELLRFADQVILAKAPELVTTAVTSFDDAFYISRYNDVANAIQQGNFACGYEHYRLFGEAENRNPSAWMDIAAYKEANSDIVATGIGALNHYMQYGMGEGRIITAADEGLWG